MSINIYSVSDAFSRICFSLQERTSDCESTLSLHRNNKRLKRRKREWTCSGGCRCKSCFRPAGISDWWISLISSVFKCQVLVFACVCVWQCQLLVPRWVPSISKCCIDSRAGGKKTAFHLKSMCCNAMVTFLKVTSPVLTVALVLHSHSDKWHCPQPTVMTHSKAERTYWMCREKSLPAGLRAGNTERRREEWCGGMRKDPIVAMELGV